MRLRDLDIRIAQEIFGYPVDTKEVCHYGDFGDDWYVQTLQMCTEVFDDGSGEWWVDVPDYSSSMGDAWKIVEHLKSKGVYFELDITRYDDNDFIEEAGYTACFEASGIRRGSAWSKNPAEAICKAALLLGVSK